MTISKLELDTVLRGIQAAEAVRDLYSAVKALNIDYDASGGVKSTIDDAKLAEVGSLSGLTKTQLDDGMYALTSVLKTDIETSYAQIEQLAARGS